MLAFISLFFPAIIAVYICWKCKRDELSWEDYAGLFVIMVLVFNVVNICVLYLVFGNTDYLLEKLNAYNGFTAKYIVLSLIQVFVFYGVIKKGDLKFIERIKTKAAFNDNDIMEDGSSKKSNIKNMFQLRTSFGHVAGTLLVTITIGSVLLTLACMLPKDRIDRNIRLSSEEMTKQGNYPTLMRESVYLQMDNWTEAALLNMIYTGSDEQPLESAFAQKQYSIKSGGASGVEKLYDVVNDIDNPNGVYTLRSTYWLGVRILLMPLLVLKDYYWIRLCIVFFSFVLLAVCTLKIGKELGLQQGIAFISSFILLNWYVSMGQWCNGAPLLWISCIVILFLLRSRRRLDICCLFTLIGALTSYFDWFSCPLITFGYPVVILILLKTRTDKTKNMVDYFNVFFRSAVGWCLGYGGMLAGRVGISTLVAGKGALENFTGRAFYNVTSTGETGGSRIIDIWHTIIKGFHGGFPVLLMSEYQTKIVLAVCIIAMLFLTAVFIQKLPQLGIFFLVSLTPFAWFIVFNGYCRVHYWIAYRVFSLTAFAWMMIIISILEYLFLSSKRGQGNKMRVLS